MNPGESPRIPSETKVLRLALWVTRRNFAFVTFTVPLASKLIVSDEELPRTFPNPYYSLYADRVELNVLDSCWLNLERTHVVQLIDGTHSQEDPVSIRNFSGVLADPTHRVVEY